MYTHALHIRVCEGKSLLVLERADAFLAPREAQRGFSFARRAISATKSRHYIRARPAKIARRLVILLLITGETGDGVVSGDACCVVHISGFVSASCVQRFLITPVIWSARNEDYSLFLCLSLRRS